jgi:hypothetical protein
MRNLLRRALVVVGVAAVWSGCSLALLATDSIVGDFDMDGKITSNDMDLLTKQVNLDEYDEFFDLNMDAAVNQADRHIWVDEIAYTYYGDANLNGVFNTGDLVHVFQAGEYDDGIVGNSLWDTGDWDGDLEFASGDLVVALSTGAFMGNPRLPPHPGPKSVPEPASHLLIVIGAMAASLVRKRQGS